MKQLFTLLTVMTLSTHLCSAQNNPPLNTTQRFRITVGKWVLTARIYDNATARGFIAQLPLTVDMDDYAGAEKIFYPPEKLPTTERHTVNDPAIGDINVYAPWGNIAIFYKNYSTTRELIRIGRIEEGMEVLSLPGKINNVTFEVYEEGDPTGVSKTEAQEIPYKVFSTADYIEVLEEVKRLTLFSMNGSWVAQVSKNRLNTSHLIAGVYVLKIETEDRKIITQRIIKN